MLQYTRLRGISLLLFLLSFFLSIKVLMIHTNLTDQPASRIDTKPVNVQAQVKVEESSDTKTNAAHLTKKISLQISNTRPNEAQILIYHTHNRESWLPELNGAKNADQAFDRKINVTLLGRYLTEQLTNKGMNVIHSDQDYPSSISNFNYAKSYFYSKYTVTKELAINNTIKYVFDLHRDSESRDKTTIRYSDLNYAQVYFVVGTNNPNWKKTMRFASRLQDKLNKRIPGISKGIYQKDRSSGNGKYNQSLSDFSALIEIGGVYNTLKENYRTVSILAEVIHEIWHEDNNQAVHPQLVASEAM